MKGILYVPYGNGDAINGFELDKNLTAAQYVKMENKEHEEFKDTVTEMMYTQYGSNMEYNSY